MAGHRIWPLSESDNHVYDPQQSPQLFLIVRHRTWCGRLLSFKRRPEQGQDMVKHKRAIADAAVVTGGTGARVAWKRPDVLLAVAAGGLLGAPARYAVGQLLPTDKDGFPWSTFLINVSGALLLGALVVLLLERFPPNRYARAFFGTGFLGAYTTFSTYMVETVVLAKDGYVARATAYLLGSLVVGLFAAWLGTVIGRSISSLGRGRDGFERRQ